MERPLRLRLGLPARLLAAIVMLAAVPGFAGSPAFGGIRDMVKSAKGKAAQAAAQKPANQAGKAGRDVEFDDTVRELAGDLLDKLIACRKAAEATTKGRPALVERRDAIPREINELSGKHGGAIFENANKRGEVDNCMGMALQEIKDRKVQEEQQRILANPASAEKLLKLSAAMNDAQLKGDTATVNRIMKEVDALYAPTHADTLVAEKKCGPMPALHPAKVKIDALEKELAEIDQKIRDMDKKALKIQVEKCGMTEGQIAMAWERIELYLQRLKHNQEPSGFSSTELKALAERKDALATAVG